jgi:acetolactate synthase small subunit
VEVTWSSEILVALVAASAAVIGAIVSAISATTSVRLSRRAEAEAQRSAYDLDRRRQGDESRRQHLTRLLDLVERQISCLQAIRDTLQVLSISNDSGINKEAMLPKITSDAETYRSLYEGFVAIASKEEAEVPHKVKGMVTQLAQRCAETMQKPVEDDGLEPISISYSEERARLAEHQNHLRDLRHSLLMALVAQ